MDEYLEWSSAAKSLGDLTRAREILNSAPEPFLTDAAYWIAMGKIARDLQEYSSAIEHFQTAWKVSSNSDAALCQLGIVYELLEDYNNAANCYKKAIDIRPEDGMHWLGYAKCLQAQARHSLAEEAFAKAEQALQNDSHYNRACFYALKGDLTTALGHLSAFCKENPFARKWAKQDPDLRSIQNLPEFTNALNGDYKVQLCVT